MLLFKKLRHKMKPAFTSHEIVKALHTLHAEMIEHHDNLLLWMPINLEDMADLITIAITIEETPE